MDRREVIQLLKDDLKIEIEDTIQFGPVREIKIVLSLDGFPIADSSFILKELI